MKVGRHVISNIVQILLVLVFIGIVLLIVLAAIDISDTNSIKTSFVCIVNIDSAQNPKMVKKDALICLGSQ